MKHLTLEERETIESLLKENNTFTFIGDTGNNYPYTSFRIILTPTK